MAAGRGLQMAGGLGGTILLATAALVVAAFVAARATWGDLLDRIRPRSASLVMDNADCSWDTTGALGLGEWPSVSDREAPWRPVAAYVLPCST